MCLMFMPIRLLYVGLVFGIVFFFFAVFSECLDSCWPNRADSGSRDKPDDPSCSAV